MNINTLKLCLVTHIQHQSISQYKHFIREAIQGGVTCVQLRQKEWSDSQLKQLALELKSLLHDLNIPLIINDYIELAIEIDADGVHLGQTDLSPTAARKILGPQKIIGLSVETMAQVELANQDEFIDYIAASAVFHSRTKPTCHTIWGLDGLTQVIKKSKHRVVAIGGINLTNIKDVWNTGVHGIAVISALHDAINPKQTAELLMRDTNVN